MKILFRLSLFFSAIFFVDSALAQQIELTKKNIRKAFANSAQKKGHYDGNADTLEWQACEPNYYRSDTVRLYNHHYYYLWNEDSCCTIVTWSFDHKIRLSFANSFYCFEPPVDEILSRQLRLSKENGNIIIRITAKGGSAESYKVLSLERRSVPGAPRPILVLTLLRL